MTIGIMRPHYRQILPTLLTFSYITSSSAFTPPKAVSSFKAFTPGSQTFTSLKSTSSAENNPILPPINDTTKRLFLVRHGEVIPPGGVHGVFYGSEDVPLSPLGELEAIAAAKYLQQFDLEHVACSPLKRAIFGAQETLKLQSYQEGKDLKIFNGFSELDRGAWCGKRKDEIGEELMDRFNACDESVTPEGGESYPFLKKRVLEARDQLLSQMEPGRCSAIVSHLQVTRSMLRYVL